MFASIDKIDKLQVPVHVLHGEADTVVPTWHGKASSAFSFRLEMHRLSFVAGAGSEACDARLELRTDVVSC